MRLRRGFSAPSRERPSRTSLPPSRLRAALAERSLSPRHAQDLLTAFRMDVTRLRYRNWDELIDYCRFSAMPVGRFVLDVHGESRSTWPASDALCAALQINNHIQDCGADYRNLDRVYVPLDALAAAGARVEELAAARASPALLECLHALARRNEALLRESFGFAAAIADFRLSLEVAVITALAQRILTPSQDPRSARRQRAFDQVRRYGRHLRRRRGRRVRAPRTQQIGIASHKSKGRMSAGATQSDTIAERNAGVRQFVLCRDADPARGPARRHVRGLRLLPAGR